MGPDAAGNPLQYTFRENDGTGLDFYQARYYDPVLKRFISSDPIGLAGGLNTYAYVQGNPLSWVDPEGLWANIVGGAAIGAGMDIAIQMMVNGGKFQCIKWDVVLIAATVGAVNPLSSLNALNSAVKAKRQWSGTAGLRNGSRAAKRTSQRGDKHNARSWKEGASWAAVEGGTEGIGNLIPDEKHWRIGEECECK